jgi:hypothetical protein
MAAVGGYLVATALAIAVSWLVAGRGYTVTRDRAVNLGEVGGRHVAILSGLSGFESRAWCFS